MKFKKLLERNNINACAVSNIGKIRSNHEDNFMLDDGQMISETEQGKIRFKSRAKNNGSIFKSLSIKYSDNAIFSVSDGMGGHKAGEIASNIAVKKMAEFKNYILNDNIKHSLIDRYQEYIISANSEINKQSKMNPEYSGMGATIITLVIKNNSAIALNLGDSRAYIYKDGILSQISNDHTEGQHLLDKGIISKDKIELMKSKKALLRYLGMPEEYAAPEAEASEIIRIDNKMYFILCSDGLTDVLPDDEISFIIDCHRKNGRVKNIAKALVNTAIDGINGNRGGIDNITVMVVEVTPCRFCNVFGYLKKIFKRKYWR